MQKANAAPTSVRKGAKKDNRPRKGKDQDKRYNNPNTGRRALDPSLAKKPVQVYIEQYKIDALSIDGSRIIALSALESAFKALNEVKNTT